VNYKVRMLMMMTKVDRPLRLGWVHLGAYSQPRLHTLRAGANTESKLWRVIIPRLLTRVRSHTSEATNWT